MFVSGPLLMVGYFPFFTIMGNVIYTLLDLAFLNVITLHHVGFSCILQDP
jgi:hypothetical protein